MKFENTQVMNLKSALRGMRNPKESWNRSDTTVRVVPKTDKAFNEMFRVGETPFSAVITVGPNDMKLAQTLIQAGPEHRKFLRQIFVSVDITAPLYWWKEFSTYRVGVTANSTSTMHKLATTPITIGCFETGDYNPTATEVIETGVNISGEELIIQFCEGLRQKFLETKDKSYWKELIRWLPESWLQTRTVTMSYETIYAIYHQRQFHKLNEWSGKDNEALPNFAAWVKTLPYAEEFLLV